MNGRKYENEEYDEGQVKGSEQMIDEENEQYSNESEEYEIQQ